MRVDKVRWRPPLPGNSLHQCEPYTAHSASSESLCFVAREAIAAGPTGAVLDSSVKEDIIRDGRRRHRLLAALHPFASGPSLSEEPERGREVFQLERQKGLVILQKGANFRRGDA
jgi:hypothetical protein